MERIDQIAVGFRVALYILVFVAGSRLFLDARRQVVDGLIVRLGRWCARTRIVRFLSWPDRWDEASANPSRADLEAGVWMYRFVGGALVLLSLSAAAFEIFLIRTT